MSCLRLWGGGPATSATPMKRTMATRFATNVLEGRAVFRAASLAMAGIFLAGSPAVAGTSLAGSPAVTSLAKTPAVTSKNRRPRKQLPLPVTLRLGASGGIRSAKWITTNRRRTSAPCWKAGSRTRIAALTTKMSATHPTSACLRASACQTSSRSFLLAKAASSRKIPATGVIIALGATLPVSA